MSSPFGDYSSKVASVAAIVVIGAWLLATFLNLPGRDDIRGFAFIALGTIFGSSLTVNGWKKPLAAAHSRTDRVVQAVTAIASASPSISSSAVSDIIEGTSPQDS